MLSTIRLRKIYIGIGFDRLGKCWSSQESRQKEKVP